MARSLSDLRNKYLALTISAMLHAFLGGISVHQCIAYLRDFPKDRRLFRRTAIAVVSLNALHVIAAVFTVLVVCDRFMQRTGPPYEPGRFIMVRYLLGQAVQATAQSFFCYRIYIFSSGSKSERIALLGAFLVFSTLAINTTYSVFYTSYRLRYQENARIVLAVGCAMAILTDMFIFGTLLWVIMSTTADFRSKKTWIIVKRLSIIALQTNAITACMVVALVAVTFTQPLYLEPVAQIIPTFFTTSVMVHLSARSKPLTFEGTWYTEPWPPEFCLPGDEKALMTVNSSTTFDGVQPQDLLRPERVQTRSRSSST